MSPLFPNHLSRPASHSLDVMNSARRRRVLLGVALVFWLLIVTSGMALFWSYENSSGLAAAAPVDWPSESRIERATDRATLVVLTHPHCPCTRATLHELSRLVTKLGDRLKVYTVFIKPKGVEPDWEKTETWSTSEEIPGVTVVRDDDGVEAARFDAHTSGQALLYDMHGNLIFNGGLTSGRGQQGDNAGAAAIAAFVTGDSVTTEKTNVFGCPLFARDRDCKGHKEPSHAKSTR